MKLGFLFRLYQYIGCTKSRRKNLFIHVQLFMENFRFNNEGELELSAAKIELSVGSCSLDSLLSGLILLLDMMKDNILTIANTGECLQKLFLKCYMKPGK